MIEFQVVGLAVLFVAAFLGVWIVAKGGGRW